ncbi:MAG: hypothetical protein WD379_09975 [Dehalococcoidia bacterium]
MAGAATRVPRTLPMETAGTHHFIERTHREGGVYQWVRETYTNSDEAKATRVEFGIEWQAVENLGAYRRVIADDGQGMTADQLVEFFNTFGGGGKPIGGVHENFGVGAKTSLLPWNRYGVVVVSWVNGEGSMIWIHWDPDIEEYGLRLMEAEDPDTADISLESVYEPFDDEQHGCDWSKVKPHWIKDHGTVVVLLGNEPNYDTVLGDPNRAESDIKGISAFLNRRVWELRPALEVYIDELRTNDRGQWPDSESVAHGPQPKQGPDRRTNLRKIEGAKFYIEYPTASFKSGKLKASGTVGLHDGTEVDWYLWAGGRPAVQSYAAISGYIGALYKGELYDVTLHQATYRSFGVTESTVRRCLWLIVRPPVLDEHGRHGVYPRTDRNALLLQGGPDAGSPLPMADWAAGFADQMPEEIVTAISEARTGVEGTLDETWRHRLADRFGSRWRIPRLRARMGGSLTAELTHEGSRPKRIKARRRKHGHGRGGGTGGGAGGNAIGRENGGVPADRKMVYGGVPTYVLVSGDDIEDGALAAWSPNHPGHTEGAVLLNVDHSVLRAEIEHWQSQFADHLADDIANEVLKAYGEIAVSKVAHSEHLRGQVASQVIDQKYRSPEALTMALLGLFAEEAVIAPRIGGKFRKRSSVGSG